MLLRLPLCDKNRTVIFDLVRRLQSWKLKRSNLEVSQSLFGLIRFKDLVGLRSYFCCFSIRLVFPLMRKTSECHLKVQMRRTDTWSIDPRMLKSTWEMQDWLNHKIKQMISTSACWWHAGMGSEGFVLRFEEHHPPRYKRSRGAESWWVLNIQHMTGRYR